MKIFIFRSRDLLITIQHTYVRTYESLQRRLLTYADIRYDGGRYPNTCEKVEVLLGVHQITL